MKISERKVNLWHIIITNVIMIVMGIVVTTLFYAKVDSHMSDAVKHTTLREKNAVMELEASGYPYTITERLLVQELKKDIEVLKNDIREIKDLLRNRK
jgi:hypothetical protein